MSWAHADKTASSWPVRQLSVYWKSVKNGQTKPTCAMDKNILVIYLLTQFFDLLRFRYFSQCEARRHNFNLPEFTTETELGARFTSTVYRRKEVEIC